MHPLHVLSLSVLSFGLSGLACIPGPYAGDEDSHKSPLEHTTHPDFQPVPRSLEARQNRQKAIVYGTCSVANTVALTFDDGPHEWTKLAADTVANAGGKATFFVNGLNWGCAYNNPYAQYLKYAYDQGHQIASHTWSHKHLATLKWDPLHHEMFLAEQLIQKVTGAYPAFMRPPFGNVSDLVLEAAFIRNQAIAMWSFDSGDTFGISIDEQKARFDNWLSGGERPISGNILMHDVHESTVKQLLPYMIPKLKAAGFKLVTTAECLGHAPYHGAIQSPAPRDATWKC